MRRTPPIIAVLPLICLALAFLLAGSWPATAHAAPEVPAATRDGATKSAPQPPIVPGAAREVTAPPAVTVRATVPAVILGDALDLSPYIDYLADPQGDLDITAASQPANAGLYRPFPTRALDRLRREESGPVWLRIVLAPAEDRDTRAPTYLIDLGSPAAGSPVLYSPVRDDVGGTEWRETIPGVRGILLLPEPRREALACYLRLDNIPGMWFSPVLRTPQNAATSWSSLYRMAGIFTLALLVLICVLRGLAERGQWRFWAVLYLAAVLAQAWFGVTATAGAGYTPAVLAGLMTPGLAMLLLPHVGRHLMRTDQHSRAVGVQLFILGFAGVAMAVLPLVPSFQWTARYTEFWPAAMLILVPTCLWALLSGLPGAARFLLGCLIPPAAVAASVLGTRSGLETALLAALPLWGTALGALLIVGLPQPAARGGDGDDDDTPAPTGGSGGPAAAGPLDMGGPSGLSIDTAPPAPIAPPAAEERPAQPPAADQSCLSDSMTAPMRSLARGMVQLAGNRDLPAQAREQVGSVLGAVEDMARAMSAHHAVTVSAAPVRAVFELKAMAYAAQDDAMDKATANGTSLPCTIDPHLASHYLGCGEELRAVLAGLLADMVGPSRGGTLSLTVQRAPGTSPAGDGRDTVLFTVTRSGEGRSEPSALALARAQTLARACDGAFSLQCRDGASILSLTMPLLVREAPEPEPEPEAEPAPEPATAPGPRSREFSALMLADNPNIAVQLLGLLNAARCPSRRAGSLDNLLALYRETPAHLIILQGRSATPQSAGTLAAIREHAKAAGLVIPLILAYTVDESSWRALSRAGFTHALTLPVEREAFLGTVEEAREAAAPDLGLTAAEEAGTPVPDLFGPGPMDMTPPARGGESPAPPAAGTEENAASGEKCGNSRAARPDEFADMASSLHAMVRGLREQPEAGGRESTPAADRPEATAPAGVSTEAVAFSPKHDTMQTEGGAQPAPDRAPGPVQASPAQPRRVVMRTSVKTAVQRQTPAGALEQSLARATAALNGGNLDGVSEHVRALSAAASLRNMPAVARIAALALQAAESRDEAAVRDLLPELSMALERRIREIGVKP